MAHVFPSSLPMPKVEQVELSQHFYQGPITHYTREKDDETDGWWIVLHCANGGRICVLTTTPLVFVDPNQH